MNKTKFIAVIQARKDSKRLPQKIFANLAGIPVLGVIIANLKQIPELSEVWVATAEPGAADVTALAHEWGAKVYIGHPTNVLSRYIEIGEMTNATHILRATGDNPFVPLENPASLISLHQKELASAVAAYTNLPLGMAMESLALKSLQDSYPKIKRLPEWEQASFLEHVSTYLKQHREQYQIMHELWPWNQTHSLENKKPDLRLTIDEREDLLLAENIADALNQIGRWPHFELTDILNILAENPQWLMINRHIHQRSANHAELAETANQ